MKIRPSRIAVDGCVAVVIGAALVRWIGPDYRLSAVGLEWAEFLIEIFGEHGALKVDGNGYLSMAKVGDGDWTRFETDRGELAPGMGEGSWSRGFTAFSQQIVNSLRERRTTVEGAATFEDGYRTQLVLDAALRSNESGCWETVLERIEK